LHKYQADLQNFVYSPISKRLLKLKAVTTERPKLNDVIFLVVTNDG